MMPYHCLQLKRYTKVIVRPSGTEPKMKLYLSVRAGGEAQAEAALKELSAGAEALIQIND